MSSNLSEAKKLLFEAVRSGNLKDVAKIVNLYGLSFSADLFDGYVLLCNAFQYKQYKIAYFLLNKGAKVKGESDASPLHLAAEGKNLVLVEALLQCGAEINCLRLRDKYTPLHIACYNGDTEMINLLLKSGANPNSKAYDNATPLHIAACEGKFESVESLLEFEADVDCLRLPDKYTPLHIACKGGWADSVDALLKCGADIDAGAYDGVTPLHLATYKNLPQMIENFAQQGARINCVRHSDKYTPLLIACEKKAIKCVRILLKNGADANAKASNGTTALHLASLTEQFGIVKALLDHGAHVNGQRLPDYYTPLHIACEKKCTKVADLLLSYGADPNILAKDNILPVHLAVEKKCLETVTSLIKHGAKLNCSRRKFDYTPLHLACQDLHSEGMVKLLVENGADPNIKSFDDETPMYSALRRASWRTHHKIKRVLELLVEHGEQVNCQRSVDQMTPLHVACEEKCSAAVEFLLKSGADPNVRSANSRTPLHLAIEAGCSDTVRFLLSNPKTQVNCPRLPSNYTPLRIACAKKHKNIVISLLNHGADPDVKARDGSTPLHFAVMKGYLEIVEQLLNHFADINAETRKGSSPLHLAMKGRTKVKVVKALKQHLIKLNVAGLYVSKKILPLLQNSEGLLDFELACEEEVKEMKSKQVTDLFTIFDVLKNQKNPVYMKNKTLMMSLMSLDFREFPYYQSLLLNCLKKSKQRIKLLTSGEKYLNVILRTSNVLNGKRFRNLPDEILVEIISYLSDEALRNLITCGKELKQTSCNVHLLFS